MIILDTNVISETMRREPNAAVIGWLDGQSPSDLYLCSSVLAELHYGIARLPDSERRTILLGLCRDMTLQIFDGRILAFDTLAAEAYGPLVSDREKQGRPIAVMDAMIAAIAYANGAALATRNTEHFARLDIALIDPFAEA